MSEEHEPQSDKSAILVERAAIRSLLLLLGMAGGIAVDYWVNKQFDNTADILAFETVVQLINWFPVFHDWSMSDY